MKRFGLGFLFLCSVSLFAASKDYNVSFRQIDAQKSQLTYMLSDFDIQTRMVNDRLFTEILFHSFNHTSQKGFAQLPVITKAVQLSPDKNIDLIIKNVEYEDYTLDDPLLPSPGVKYRTEKNSNDYIKFDRSSLTDNWYPPEIAAASSPYIVKDIRGTNVTLHPFRYNAAKKILRVYTRIVIEMDENNSTPVNPLISHGSPISDELRSVYQSAFMNFKSTNALSKYSQLTMQQLGDILVIATPRDETAIDSFINWKKEKGYHVYKEIVPAGTNVTDLIKQKYNENNKILYVQLIGDWQDIKGYADSSSGAPLDPKLGCVVGDDDYPDICIGRFPANSADDVTAQVSKIIQYEKSMTEQDTWLSTATGIASDEGSGD
ncbi:MAG: C25 family peptidase propeptide domain-containing protein, partial [Calditrichaceae bacterium]